MEYIGEEFIPKAEAMAPAKGSGDLGADHDLAVGEREDVSGRGVAQMPVVKAATFAGGNQNHAEFRGQAAEPGRRKAPEGRVQFTTKIGQARRMPSLTVDPPDGRLFWIHGGPWGSGCGGEADSPHRRPGLCGRPATARN